MRQGLVSIMMPAFNAARYIRQAIDSLLAQTYTNWELVVVNDGSTDQTGALVAAYDDPRIRLIHQPNRGEAAARNTALDHMNGEFVAFLDADDLYLPDHLAACIDFLTVPRAHDGVYADGYYMSAEGVRLKRLSARRRGPYSGRIFAEVVRGSDLFGPPLCVVLRRRPILRHALRYDADIVIGPDWLFFMRYAQVASFGYLDRITCLYRVHQNNITVRVDREKRALQLATCRMRSIEMDGFNACPVDVRTNVFYDLLVNLLRGYPERQAEVTRLPQFCALPAREQARLFRLTASKALATDTADPRYIRHWLARAHSLDPADWRGAYLFRCHGASPALCKLAVRMRTWRQSDPLVADPFADLRHL